MNSQSSRIAKYVLSQVEFAPSGRSVSVIETKRNIEKAIESLLPFAPEPMARCRINSFLENVQADFTTCLTVWALYKDSYDLGLTEAA